MRREDKPPEVLHPPHSGPCLLHLLYNQRLNDATKRERLKSVTEQSRSRNLRSVLQHHAPRIRIGLCDPSHCAHRFPDEKPGARNDLNRASKARTIVAA